jgi:hypothetical protein
MGVNIFIWLNMLKARISITVAPSLVVISNRLMCKESTKQNVLLLLYTSTQLEIITKGFFL